MKKIIYLFSFLLCLISVSAFYGGESQLIETIENCDTFFVSVTADRTINNGEYWFDNCDQIKTNFWECKCDENNAFDLILNTQINTLNFYNFSIMNLEDIQIENENVIIKSVSYINNILELELEGEGIVNVSIDTGSLGKPNNVYVNDVSVPFKYIDGKVIFEAHFSTNIVKLDYYTAPSTTTGGGGGGGPGPTRTPSVIITPPTPVIPEVVPTGEIPTVTPTTPTTTTAPTGLAAITGAVVGLLGTGGAIVALILAIGGIGTGSYFLVRKKKK